MAAVGCLNSQICHSRSLYCEKPLRLKKSKRAQVVCIGNYDTHHQNSSLPIQYCQSGSVIIRRQVLFQSVIAAFSFPPIVSIALAADTDVLGDFRLYSDEANKFKILIPQGWQVGAGDNDGIKSVTGFFPAEPSKSNGIYVLFVAVGDPSLYFFIWFLTTNKLISRTLSVTVVITGLGPDFTRLESFGKVDEFAETLVSGLDRSWQRPPGVAAKLIDSKAANGLYYINYTLQNPGETRRHLFSVLGMATTGWYNRLYTVTGQYVDEDSEKYGSQIEKAVASFRFI